MIITQNLLTAPALVGARFRGLPFFMPNSRHETGRRVQRIFFPGRDDTAFQDLGALDGPIKIKGLVHGDDYVNQSLQLQQAFRTPGSALLVHPWLGQILVVLTAPVEISYDFQEQRVARFEATFAPYYPPTPPPTDTLANVAVGYQNLTVQAQGLLSTILSGAALTLGLVGAVQGFCNQVATIWAGVAFVDSVLAAAVATPVTALGAVETFTADFTYAAAVAAVLAAPSAALVVTSETLQPSAIGPGDLPPVIATLDATVTTAAILAAQVQFLAVAVSQPSLGALALAASAMAVSDAANAGTDLVFDSQQDALVWLVQILAAIDATANLATTLAPAQPIGAGLVWNALQALRGAVATDINAQVGRLPVVQTLTLLNSLPAWLVAQGLSGDTPTSVLATYTDIVARNNVANPALTGPGDIEVLVA